MKKKVELFLDSGAFSAWTQGVPINIQEYIDFIKENEEVIEVYANLDGIPQKAKDAGTQIKFNKIAAEKTLENQKIMEDAGLNPIPVFHFGEPYNFLEHYVNNYDYIALGVAGNSGVKLIPWLNECFLKYICDEDGMPKVKVHGFAVTSVKLMVSFPWFSVDSTSWVITGRMGSIFIPRKKDGKWVYDENSWKIAVSNKSPGKKEAGKHITTLTPKEEEIFLGYIHEKGYSMGKSRYRMVDQTYKLKENERWVNKKPTSKKKQREVEIIIIRGISNIYQLRDEMNIIYFLDLEASRPKWPWAFKIKEVQDGFF